MIFHADISNLVGIERVTFMRNCASHLFGIGVKDLHMESGNRMDKDGLISSRIRMAGPGDRGLKGNPPGFTVSWKLRCGYDLAGKL